MRMVVEVVRDQITMGVITQSVVAYFLEKFSSYTFQYLIQY